MSPQLRAPARRSPFARRLEKQVLAFIRERRVLGSGESVVVAVSGGPDSTVLLTILAHLRAELRLKIVAAHFDHKLRSRKDAEGDREFVAKLCRSLRIPLVTGAGDVKRRAKRERETIEEAARKLRYRFLGREAKRVNAGAVVVGHTLNDRAETVLLNILRGAGLDGLATMPPRSPWPFGAGPDIARPMLDVTRDEVERHCDELGVEPRRDPTNDLPVATRNRVRHELMPVLRSFNPKAPEALARLAEAVTIDSDYLDSLTEKEWKRFVRVSSSQVTFSRGELIGLPQAIIIRVLRRAARHIGAQPQALHLERAVNALGRGRSRLDLPGGVISITSGEVVVAGEPERSSGKSILPNKLAIPGRARAGSWNIEATKVERDAALPRDAYSALIDVDAIDGPLLVRSRKPGDRLRPLGLNGTKKLQDILVDAKVPQEDRDSVAVVTDRLGIVWVAGHCIDQRVAVSGKTRRVMRLRARRKWSR